MFYADRVGLAKVFERVSAFHRELGQRWEPAPLLARLAKEGSTFKEFDKSRASEPPPSRDPRFGVTSARATA
jgi:3-hydroxyacyl-CoA dehydrogenase